MRRRRPEQRLPQLAQVERQVRFALTNPVDAHRLRRSLRTIAAQRLAARHGIDLDANPAAARAVLGAEVWELLGPTPPGPVPRDGGGFGTRQLRAILDTLEGM